MSWFTDLLFGSDDEDNTPKFSIKDAYDRLRDNPDLVTLEYETEAMIRNRDNPEVYDELALAEKVGALMSTAYDE